jgi:hypothetical protein
MRWHVLSRRLREAPRLQWTPRWASSLGDADYRCHAEVNARRARPARCSAPSCSTRRRAAADGPSRCGACASGGSTPPGSRTPSGGSPSAGRSSYSWDAAFPACAASSRFPPACCARWEYLLFTFIGSALWNTLLVGAGYALGSQWEQVSAVVGPLSKPLLAFSVWPVERCCSGAACGRGGRAVPSWRPPLPRACAAARRRTAAAARRPGAVQTLTSR